MNDPILHRLRTESTRPDADVPLDAVLATIHARTAGERPGALSRRRRTVRTAAVGVVGAGVVAGVLVLPGLVPGSGPDAVPEPVAAPSPTTEVRDGVVGEDLDADGTVVTAVAYVERARTAVQDVDLSTLVLEVGSTFGVQHPGESALDSSADRTFTAGDGSATRWLSEQDFVASVGTSTVGVEEVKHADPAGPEGQMTYWWVSPAAGVYTQFTLPVENWDDIQEGTIREQLTAQMTDLAAQMDAIQALADQPDVVTSGPEARTVGGRPATCFELSGPGSAAPESETSMWVGGEPGTVDWTRAACFDDATHLPLSDERTEHYYIDGATETSLAVTTSEYTWHPRDEASLALLEPSVTGLREVSQDEFTRLTS
ncbi:hypothetical protein CBR64_05995 [Cellulosimicrobium cellulans]|uniref:Uncharacterized protein n=1 Tax=Cellulosimicrobium cellulans TaxID=1710 RepID=A0A1Y0HSJ0_CELCE|nr:hypothetical protein [Cellulosimicrobium cellulans]ARU51107.1 hypothetical protein CBR64_05995 [Cellulosimicrobium cellulans]